MHRVSQRDTPKTTVGLATSVHGREWTGDHTLIVCMKSARTPLILSNNSALATSCSALEINVMAV